MIQEEIFLLYGVSTLDSSVFILVAETRGLREGIKGAAISLGIRDLIIES